MNSKEGHTELGLLQEVRENMDQIHYWVIYTLSSHILLNIQVCFVLPHQAFDNI